MPDVWNDKNDFFGRRTSVDCQDNPRNFPPISGAALCVLQRGAIVYTSQVEVVVVLSKRSLGQNRDLAGSSMLIDHVRRKPHQPSFRLRRGQGSQGFLQFEKLASWELSVSSEAVVAVGVSA